MVREHSKLYRCDEGLAFLKDGSMVSKRCKAVTAVSAQTSRERSMGRGREGGFSTLTGERRMVRKRNNAPIMMCLIC